MINRSMVREKVVQTLFAFYECGDKTPATAQKELLHSFANVYDLYMLLLDLPGELIRIGETQIAEETARAKAMHRPFTPNRRFIESKLAKQLFSCSALRKYMDTQHLSWEPGVTALEKLYLQLSETEFYQTFTAIEAPAYEDEKLFFRQFYSTLLPDNEHLLAAFEEMEIAFDKQAWEADLNVVLSYVVKTVKRLKADGNPDEAVLPMFDAEDEVRFARDLLHYSIANHDEYTQIIANHLKGWAADRIAVMDRLILATAITEMMQFPDIALEVSINEYVEIAKTYSSNKSYLFVNGILEEVIKDLIGQGKLIKPFKNK